ncbi:MAG: tRNA pseudouridine(38-40) synthase TruA [Alphaproteobacteria bacterium]|nr:tRNA pseudouridine(38-40) synthase TruA [Alphaproteobacteria bacterium]MDX5369275.1 tRNA pseudouridine(38-40) synthase TruA [Alphaproteobacteria bacterium]MDX5463960.1 tRNA pseudouridine(38-40) synthase TruA [Alphaproteobacteria bacterium]
MPRYRLDLEYDGGPFVGWQRQDNGPSVQQALEEAIARFAGHAVRVQGAGRTDTGVHALHQVAHVDLDRGWPADTVRDATNHHLKPAPVSVLAAAPVAGDFHARFSAVGRAYVYRLLDRRSPPALDRGRVWHVVRGLDTDAMAVAARHLVGRHDFTTFRAAQCQSASPVKTLDALEVARVGGEVHVNARARSFLHNQVRSMVGTLVEVGLGRWAPEDVARALAARDRAACGPVAPPQGLYLSAVRYPEE